MKCYVHPKEDAIAVCKACGKGVCSDCVIILAGNSYCKTCVEAGRIKAPTVEIPAVAPTPGGIPSRTPFIVGGIGAIISGVAALLVMLLGGLITMWWLMGNTELVGIGGMGGMASGILLAVGLILAGIGYLGIKRNYGYGIGTAGFAFSIVVCVFLFVSIAFGVIFMSYPYYYLYPYKNPWYAIYIISSIITLILFGIMQILWGIAHINTRQYTGTSGLAMATGIMLIISGALTASVIIAFAGIILFFVSEILAVIVFLMSNIPQLTTQTA